MNTGVTPLEVENGGTEVSSVTAYAPLCGGTTSGGAIQSVASLGTAGYALASNGAGALPSFQESTTLVKEVTLTPSQIYSMYTTPIEVIPTGGPDTYLKVLFVAYNKVYTAPAYTGGGTVRHVFGSGGSVVVAGDISSSSINTTSSQFAMRVDYPSPIADILAIRNTGIYITNLTAAFATGESSVNFRYYYRIIYT